MGRAKRALTARLPLGWRRRMWEAIPETNSRLRDALATLELTGCRPHELQTGITIELETTPEWGTTVLVFSIMGAKVGQIRDRNGKLHDRGQPERQIAVSLDSPAAQYLVERISKVGTLVVRYHRKSISNRISEFSRQLFPRHREHISAYCYRHSFATDLKDTVFEAEIRAAALGQLSDYSQCRYGRPSKGGKGAKKPAILDAFGSRPVKHSPKSDRLLRFKIASKNRKAGKAS